MKPTLKKVSKYENKFAKLQKKAAEFNFRNQLKQVKKKEFTLEEEDKEVRTIVFDKTNRCSNFSRRSFPPPVDGAPCFAFFGARRITRDVGQDSREYKILFQNIIRSFS